MTAMFLTVSPIFTRRPAFFHRDFASGFAFFGAAAPKACMVLVVCGAASFLCAAAVRFSVSSSRAARARSPTRPARPCAVFASCALASSPSVGLVVDELLPSLSDVCPQDTYLVPRSCFDVSFFFLFAHVSRQDTICARRPHHAAHLHVHEGFVLDETALTRKASSAACLWAQWPPAAPESA